MAIGSTKARDPGRAPGTSGDKDTPAEFESLDIDSAAKLYVEHLKSREARDIANGPLAGFFLPGLSDSDPAKKNEAQSDRGGLSTDPDTFAMATADAAALSSPPPADGHLTLPPADPSEDEGTLKPTF